MAAYATIGVSGQDLADRADAAVHHVARRDGVGAGFDVADGRPREQLERLVVRDLAVADHAAVAVRGVLAEADVGDEDELRVLGAHRPQRPLDDPVLVPGARALVVLLLGHAEEEQRLAAERGELARLGDEILDREAAHPGQLLVRNGRRPDEVRHHEVVEVEPRLAHEPAQGVGAAEAAKPRRGEGAHPIKGTSVRPRPFVRFGT